MRYDRRVMNILLKDIKEEIEMFHCKRSTDLEALMQENEELLLLLLSGNFIYFYLKKELKFFIYLLLLFMFFSEVEPGKTKKQMCENIKHG